MVLDGNTINVGKIKRFQKENNLSSSEFCKVCKISKGVYYKIMANKQNFRIVALFKIARVMKIHTHQLFEE